MQTGVLTLGYNVRLSYMDQSEHSIMYTKDTTPKLARSGTYLEPSVEFPVPSPIMHAI